jgi:hypothetical protein
MRTLVLAAGLLAGAMLAAPAPAFALQSADQQQVKISNGSWWGKIGDRVEVEFKDAMGTRKATGVVTKIEKNTLTVEGMFDGRKATRPIFLSEIVSLKTVGAGAPQDAPSAPAGGQPDPAKTAPAATTPDSTPAARQDPKKKDRNRGDRELGISTGEATGKVDAQGYQLDEKGYRISPKKGVFVLPWKDGVGQTARAYEIEQMALEADKWGPGQIIVMEIESPGGLVTEIYRISETIREVRKRHRLVAWIKEAISAAACTALHCDEIYFQTVGALGASTMIRGADSVKGKSLEQFMRDIGEVVESNGRPAFLFYAMVEADRILTYTKDPLTGKVTFHDRITGLPGEVVLSDAKDNLVFNASNALDCGLSKGTADTPEQLAKLLGLPEWYEVSDYGRKMAKAWQTLFKQCEEDIQKQMGRFNIQRAGGTVEQLQSQIQIGEKILQWTKRCRPCTDGRGIDPEQIERTLQQWRKQLAELRKANRPTGS